MQQIVEMTGRFGADSTFEATGSVNVMRQAVESARMGWGLATVCGVAGKGETLVEPFVSHKLSLDEVNRGFEVMEAQDGIRSVIDFA